MSILYDNIVVLAVGALTATYAWLYGGIVAAALVPVIPWLWVLLIEIMLCFPQRHEGETNYDARQRVWDSLRRDPLTWIIIAFALVLQIPFFNKGLCPICDFYEVAAAANLQVDYTMDELSQAAKSTIPVRFLPYCVDRLQHLNTVMWFIPSLTIVLAVKHCLLKRGQRSLVKFIVWNGFALAIIGFIQQATAATAPLWATFEDSRTAYFFSTFGYPNMGGDYFTSLFALSIGMWRFKIDEIRKEEHEKIKKDGTRGKRKLFWSKHYYLIPAVVSFLAALTTLSRAAIILSILLAAVFFVHTFMSYAVDMKKATRLKVGVASVLGMGLVVFFSMILTPEALRNEVNTLDATSVADRVTGKGQYHTRVAYEIWKDWPLFGCGGWGYKHMCIPKMTPEEMKERQITGGTNVHNDYLQFLAEHGLYGFGTLVAVVILLLVPLFRVWKALIDAIRFTPKSKHVARPIAIFALPASAFCILCAIVATLIHSFGDCAMRSPAVLSLFFIELAALQGFLPDVKIEKESKVPEEKYHHHHHHHNHHHH